MTTWDDVETMATSVVAEAANLRDMYAHGFDSKVSYCAIFCRDEDEFLEIRETVAEAGALANDTATGPVYVVPAIETNAGPLRVVKVRRPDQTRTERGDADFAVDKYDEFKRSVMGKEGVKLIVRDEFEMIEFMDSRFNARAYFSHPPVEQHSGVREVLAAQ